MAAKTTPRSLTNGIFSGVSGTTFTLSTTGTDGDQLKRETVEATIVLNLLALTGTTPTVLFDVDEFVDGNWIHVGTSGTLATIAVCVIDSSGGATSTGGSAFTASSNLRLLGKGTDTRVRVGVGGTIGTAQYTIDYIGYFGS